MKNHFNLLKILQLMLWKNDSVTFPSAPMYASRHTNVPHCQDTLIGKC